MFLYLVFSAPLIALGLCLYYRVTELRFSALVFVRGIVVTVPLLLLWWFLAWSFRLSYTPAAAYQHYLFTQYLYPVVPGIILFYLIERAVLRQRGHVSIVSLSVFLGGIYFVHSVIDVLRIPYHYGPYVGFILPTLRLALIIVVPPLLGAVTREARPLRFVWAAAVVLIPVAFAGIAVLHELRFFVVGYVLTALSVALAGGLHYLLLSNYYPRRPRAFAGVLGRHDENAQTGSETGEKQHDGDEDVPSGPGTRLFPDSVHDR
ncbi:MAG: hypothetical protein ACQETQ_06095 [Spirochaetota bacterium]